jgi:putative ATP-dependent endonuclease of OLD family
VIYCTHSPLFVGLDRFDQIRVVRKVHHAPEMPKKTCVLSRTLNEVAERIGQLEGKAEGTYTGETLRPRLTALLDHWISEGFFASVVVLVEGDTDRAAILGAGKANNLELDSLGISVLACNGKSGIFTAGAVFQSFGTPTFCIWDSDEHLAGCGKTRFEADAVPRNSLVSTAQPDKKKVCVDKTSSSWMCSATLARSSEYPKSTPCARFVS